MALAINIVLGANTVNFSRNIQKATKKAEQELGGLAGLAQKAFDKINAGTLIGAGTLTTIVAAADKMQSLASKVKLATDGANEFTAVQNQLRNIANEQRSSFEGVVDLYSSSQRALSQLGKSQQDVINFTRNMTMAMNLGGGSAQAQAAALTQLGQALGSGALRGDEFNSVAEQAPILMELIAKRMGVATAALRDLAKEGKITADVVYEAVSGSTQALEEMMSKTNFTMSQGWQVVKDNFGYLVHDIINETTGIAGAVSDVLAFVGQNLKTIATIAGVAAAVIGAKMLLGSAQVKEFAASVLTKTTAMRADAAETIRNAYSLETYNQANLRLIHTKNLLSQRLAVARLAKLHYSMSIKEAWATTTGYIQSQLTLTNAKNITTAAITRATGAVVAYTRAIAASTITKRAFVGTASLASTAVGKLGTAFAAVGRIILAHPIIALTAVIGAVIARTEGLSGAVKSLGDAFSVAGVLASDFIGGVVDGLGTAWTAASNYFSGLMGGSANATSFAQTAFGGFFAGTHKGFVGVLQITARVFDLAGATIVTFTKYAWKNISSLGTAIVNVFKGVGNFLATVFEGIINHQIKKANSFIDGVNAIADVIGVGKISRIDPVAVSRFEYGKTDFGFGDFIAEVGKNNTHTLENKVVDAYEKVQQSANQDSLANLPNSVDGLAKSLDKAKGVNDAAAKAGKSLTDAHKNQQQQVDKTSNAHEKLVEAYNSQMLDWQKAMWENQHVKAGLEVEKIEWEFTADGGFAKASNAIKNNLRLQALELDRSNAIKQIQAKTREIERSHLEFGTAYHEIMAGIHDETNALSALLRDDFGVDIAKIDDVTEVIEKAKTGFNADGSVNLDGLTAVVHRFKELKRFEADTISEMMKLANAEVSAMGVQTHKTLDGLERQLTLQTTNGELAKQLLTIDHERTDTISKYGRMLSHIATGNQELADTLREQVEGNADLLAHQNKQIAVATAYQSIVSDLKTDEQKRLDTLKEQLFVLNAHQQIMGANLDIERAKQLISQNVGLATSMSHYDELNAKTAGQYASLDTGLQALLDNERLTEEERINIKQWGADERLKIEKAHSDAMRSLILSDSENMFGSLASIAKDGLGEQSRLYRAMFAMQQGFAIAQAGIAMSQAMSQGLAKGFPLGLADMALAVSHGAKIVSAIKSVVMPVGQAHDGIMSVPKSGTWNLEKGERVLPKHTAQNLDNTLNHLQAGGGGQVITVNVTVNSDGGDVQSSHDFGKNLGNAIKLAVQAELQKERRQGGLLYGR